MQTVLFYHGGPGLNSNPEVHLITDYFREQGFDLHCWHEPSNFRPSPIPLSESNPFHLYMESAVHFFLEHYNGDPLIVLGHSISANIISRLGHLHPDKIRLLVYLAPCHLPANTDKNVYRFIEKDYSINQDPRALKMQAVLNNLSGTFDANAEEGLGLMLENERLFNYYWVDQNLKQDYLSHFSEPAYAMDVERYIAVRKHWQPVEPYSGDIPAIAVLGEKDLTITNELEIKLLKNASHLETHIALSSAHYPHIEETNMLLEIIKNKLK